VGVEVSDGLGVLVVVLEEEVGLAVKVKLSVGLEVKEAVGVKVLIGVQEPDGVAVGVPV
jgi:hypothetical protein